jgi:hypothetical protein
MADKQEIIRGGLTSIMAELEPDIRRDLDHDPDAYLRLVQAAMDISVEAADSLRESVVSARAAGVSWERIGDVLRISRQAAQQRFGGPTPPADTAVWRMKPVTAFTEMEKLEEAGRHGWHSVGFGTLYHDLVRSDQRWEHRRVSMFSSRHALESAGWQRIGSMWIPWAYYARPTAEPALPDPALPDPAQLGG